MAQRLIIPLGQASGATGGITQRVFNADLLIGAVTVPDGISDDKVHLYFSNDKNFVITTTGAAVTDSVSNAINRALTGNPGGGVVVAQVGNDVQQIADLPS